MNKSAAIIIARVGAKAGRRGHSIVAGWAGVRVHTVYRWTYPQDRGGTGGIIPRRYHDAILREAAAAGIPIKESELLGVVETPPAEEEAA